MKSLALLRHAKSSWDQPNLRDFDRPLTARGRDAAALIGAQMRRRGLRFDRVLASPARRIVETIEHLEKGYGMALGARFEERIYEASSNALLALVQAIDEPAQSALLIGHNPGTQGLACVLAAKDADGLYRRVADHYPTAALALLSVGADRWSDVRPGSALVTDFLKPRELAAGG